MNLGIPTTYYTTTRIIKHYRYRVIQRHTCHSSHSGSLLALDALAIDIVCNCWAKNSCVPSLWPQTSKLKLLWGKRNTDLILNILIIISVLPFVLTRACLASFLARIVPRLRCALRDLLGFVTRYFNVDWNPRTHSYGVVVSQLHSGGSRMTFVPPSIYPLKGHSITSSTANRDIFGFEE